MKKVRKFSRASAGIDVPLLVLLTLGTALACSSGDDAAPADGGVAGHPGSASGGQTGAVAGTGGAGGTVSGAGSREPKQRSVTSGISIGPAQAL